MSIVKNMSLHAFGVDIVFTRGYSLLCAVQMAQVAQAEKKPAHGGCPGIQSCAMITNLSLETYIDVHAALTKGTSQVQKVSAVEKAMYKMSDLKQVG